MSQYIEIKFHQDVWMAKTISLRGKLNNIQLFNL
ncbi:hypothetical protein VCHENC02_5770, partial [Vibrio harveyi]